MDVRTAAGATERVRFFGFNAPELFERCGPDATFALAIHVNHFNDFPNFIYLEQGPRRTDIYGRSLYYGWIVYGGRLYILDQHMVLSGFATAWTADGQWRDGILASERQARSARRGCLWSASAGPIGGAASGGNCHPSYPTVCIPPPPPDLDCKDIPYRRFTVLPPDPHRFDADRDGIGCES